MITVGLDFGTHQTKVCIEDAEGVELNFHFQTFDDANKRKRYTLPSIIGIGRDGLVSYGYLPHNYSGRVVRYFKQAAFRTINTDKNSQKLAMIHSSLFLAYLLFDIEDKYGMDFSIQMGAPTDSSHLDSARSTAVKILSAAYKLVEDDFENDKKRFMATNYKTLVSMVSIPGDSEVMALKDEYQIRVFPEAYACLMPLMESSKISSGMSLMVDIGGGTTDISFFTIKDKKPVVYDFFSVNKGLNFLTGASPEDSGRLDANVKNESELIKENKDIFSKEINLVCKNLINKLVREFGTQTNFHMTRLMNALKDRPLIYTGGGSTFASLRRSYEEFKDIIPVSGKVWNVEAVEDVASISKKQLCPILSTAYGLSIHASNDDIQCEPLYDIFKSIRGEGEERNATNSYVFGQAIADTGFDYGNDYDAWK